MNRAQRIVIVIGLGAIAVIIGSHAQDWMWWNLDDHQLLYGRIAQIVLAVGWTAAAVKLLDTTDRVTDRR